MLFLIADDKNGRIAAATARAYWCVMNNSNVVAAFA